MIAVRDLKKTTKHVTVSELVIVWFSLALNSEDDLLTHFVLIVV